MSINKNQTPISFDFFKMDPVLPKPRNIRWTVLSDRGMPVGFQEDLMDYFGDIIDKAKIADHAGLDCGAVSADMIKKKVELYNKRGVPVFPGGMPFQMAYLSKQTERYFDRLIELGFSGVEISADSMPPIPLNDRAQIIKLARDKGLEVYTEAGEKHGDEPLTPEQAIDSMKRDLDAGALKVTVENEEFAYYYQHAPENIEKIVNSVGLDNIIFEVSPKAWPGLAAHLITEYGPNINAENMIWDMIMPFEAMRRGMSRATAFPYLTDLAC